MGRRKLAALLAVLAAAGVAGCGGDGDGDGDGTQAAGDKSQQELLDSIDTRPRDVDDSDEEIERLLADRAAAIEQRDAKAVAATATGSQRARDRRTMANLVRLPLGDVRLTPVELQISGRKAKMGARMRYRIKGATREFETGRRIVARKSAAGWRVVRDTSPDALPWEVQRYSVTRSRHIVLLTAPGVAPGELVPGLERAYRRISRDLPARDLPDRVLVLAATDGDEVGALGVRRLASNVVAMADVRREFEPGGALEVRRVLAQRMTLIMDRFQTMPVEERERTLAHEMVHTALGPDTSGRVPQWLVEGLALHVSREDLSAYTAAVEAAGQRPSLRELSRENAIGRLGADGKSAAYVIASAAAAEIADRKGNEGLFRFFEAFNDSTITGAPGPRTTDKVMRKSIGMSLRELDAAIG
jgi:hypothetical protein